MSISSFLGWLTPFDAARSLLGGWAAAGIFAFLRIPRPARWTSNGAVSESNPTLNHWLMLRDRSGIA